MVIDLSDTKIAIIQKRYYNNPQKGGQAADAPDFGMDGIVFVVIAIHSPRQTLQHSDWIDNGANLHHAGLFNENAYLLATVLDIDLRFAQGIDKLLNVFVLHIAQVKQKGHQPPPHKLAILVSFISSSAPPRLVSEGGYVEDVSHVGTRV